MQIDLEEHHFEAGRRYAEDAALGLLVVPINDPLNLPGEADQKSLDSTDAVKCGAAIISFTVDNSVSICDMIDSDWNSRHRAFETGREFYDAGATADNPSNWSADQWAIVVEAVQHAASRPFKMGHLDPVIASGLARIIEDALRGHLPQAWRVGQGRPLDPIAVEEAMAFAVSYVDVAKRGIVDDTRPVRTVCEAFGIDRRRLRDWRDHQMSLSLTEEAPVFGIPWWERSGDPTAYGRQVLATAAETYKRHRRGEKEAD